MGWMYRIKLNLLTTIKDDSSQPDITLMSVVRNIIIQLGGMSPSENGVVTNTVKATKIQERLELYSDAEIAGKFSTNLLSSASADNYIVNDENSRKSLGHEVKWKEMGMILVKFEFCIGWWQPRGFIIRTDSDKWVAYEIPLWAITMRHY